MGLMTFKGGVHPFEGKDLSKDKPIRELLPKGELVYPLSQHIGKPAVPVVTAGDAVKKDDLIAGSAEGLSANIHTGFDGVVKEVTPKGIRISRREA